MLELHFIGFGEETEQKKDIVRTFLRKRLDEIPGRDDLIDGILRGTILVGHHQTISHTLMAYAKAPYIVVHSANRHEADALVGILLSMPNKPIVVRGADHQSFWSANSR